MSKLTYIFKGDYINREQEKLFISDVISSFNRDEVTGIGIKVNNNPWSLELFTFVTIDTDYLQRDRFIKWLSTNYKERTITHNVFLMDLSISGNINIFVDQFSLMLFDSAFIWNEHQAKKLLNVCPEILETLIERTREEFEKENPQYISTNFQKPTVFISHSSLDKENIALPICDYLCSKEIPIWLDRNEIDLEDGENNDVIYQKIYNGISLCKTGVFVITENFFKSEWTKVELEICSRLNKKIILLVSKEIHDGICDFLDGAKINFNLYLDNIIDVDFSNKIYLNEIVDYIDKK